MQRHCPLCLLITACVLAGCAAQTDDPRKGGIFSYSPAAYEERVKERETCLDAAFLRAAAEREEEERLQASVTVQEHRGDEAQKKLEDMRARLTDAQRALDELKVKDARIREKLNTLRRRRGALSARLEQSAAGAGDPAARVEIGRLQADVRSLERAVEELKSAARAVSQ